MLGRLGEPASRTALVAFDTLFLISRGVEETQSVLGCGVAAVRQLAKLSQIGSIRRWNYHSGKRRFRRWLGRSENRMLFAATAGLDLFLNPRFGDVAEREENNRSRQE